MDHMTQSSFTNSLGIQFVRIPPGSFKMGSDEGLGHESPVHIVEISDKFYMSVTPVTQHQWEMLMEYNPSYFKGKDHPVEQVTWTEVQEFICRLNVQEGATLYRLPTEAEWEYAARAGSKGSYCFGDDPIRLDKYCFYRKNSSKRTQPVRNRKANNWGLHDMHGNVWEWVSDWYASLLS